MQKFIQLIILTACFSISVLMMHTQAHADLLADIQILKISPQDGRAVMKMREGGMQLIRVGDRIDAGQLEAEGQKTKDKGPEQDMCYEVVEITKGRVVFEGGAGIEKEKVIIRLEAGGQRVEKIKAMPAMEREFYRPQ